MHRYSKLLPAITSGYVMDKKTNTVFADWTPHNIRRLIIGLDKAIVQYHVVAGKVAALTRIVNYAGFVKDDIDLYQKDPSKLKSLVGVLVDARICSAVEEIVFCIKGYPTPLLQVDGNLSLLAKGGISQIGNRFPRLAKVYHLNTTVSDIEQFVKSNIDPMFLLYDGFKKQGLPVNIIANVNNEWYNGVSKFWDPKIYLLDDKDKTLYKRLISVQSKYADMKKDKEREASSDERDKRIVEKYRDLYKTLGDALVEEFDILCNGKSKMGYYNAIVLSAIEGNSLTIAYKKIYKKDLDTMSLPDFNALYDMFKKNGVDYDALDVVGVVLDKLNCPKMDRAESMKGLLNLIAVLLNIINASMFKALYEYVTLYGTEFIDDMANKLLVNITDRSNIVYNSKILNYINILVGDVKGPSPSEVFSRLGFTKQSGETTFESVTAAFKVLRQALATL